MDDIELFIDPKIKYWVLIPISLVMILTGIIKTYIMILVSPKIKTGPRVKITENQYIIKAQALISNGTDLSYKSFQLRQEYMTKVLGECKYIAKGKADSNQENNILTDSNTSDTMMDMAKGNLANYIPQTVIMWWVNRFFGGFILMKLPFPLTIKFKEMLQNGIMTSDLDVRWVSSISWYFISIFGLGPVYELLIESDEIVNLGIYPPQQQISNMPGGPTSEQIMKNLSNDLIITRHECCFDGIENRIFKLYST